MGLGQTKLWDWDRLNCGTGTGYSKDWVMELGQGTASSQLPVALSGCDDVMWEDWGGSRKKPFPFGKEVLL